MPFFRFETQALQNGIPSPHQLLRFVCHGVRPLDTISRSLRLAPLDLRYTKRPLASKPRHSKMAPNSSSILPL